MNCLRIITSCIKCLRSATSFYTTARGARCCMLCLRFATAHHTTTAIRNHPYANPAGLAPG